MPRFLIDLTYKNMKHVFIQFYSFFVKSDRFAFQLSNLVPSILNSLIVWKWAVLTANRLDICSLRQNHFLCLIFVYQCFT